MPQQRSAPSKPSRQERRQAARNDAKARQTVPLTAVPSYSRQDALAFLVLGLLAVVPYLPAMLWGGFVWDDGIIPEADPVRDVSGLWQIWFSPSAIENEAHYWPLVYTTFWLEHKLWGFDPTGYHIVNVLLHLANTLLLCLLLRRLAVPGAWVVAAVFAVHPLHVDSVAWVIERKDVMSGLFYLAAVLTYMRLVEQPNPRRYAGSLALYAAGLLSKSIVVTLPVALLIWHWWKQGRVTSADLLRLVPFFAVGLVITVGDLSFSRSVEPMSLGYSLAERTLIASHALWFYVGKLLWPTNLAVVYPLWDIRVGRPTGLGVFARRGRLGSRSLVLPVAAWARTAGLGIVLCDHAVAGVGLCRLRLYAVFFCRRPLSVSRWHRGYGRRHRRGHVWRWSSAQLVAKGCAGRCGSGSRRVGDADLAAGKHLSGQRNLLSPHRRAQPRRPGISITV